MSQTITPFWYCGNMISSAITMETIVMETIVMETYCVCLCVCVCVHVCSIYW